jgi:hypothetical protein
VDIIGRHHDGRMTGESGWACSRWARMVRQQVELRAEGSARWGSAWSLAWHPLFRGCCLRPSGTAFVCLAEDVCISLSLLCRVEAKPSVRVWPITVEMHRAVSAAVQAWTTGAVVKTGSRDKAWRAMSIGAMSIHWDPLLQTPIPVLELG